jgi:hypothetical protein
MSLFPVDTSRMQGPWPILRLTGSGIPACQGPGRRPFFIRRLGATTVNTGGQKLSCYTNGENLICARIAMPAPVRPRPRLAASGTVQGRPRRNGTDRPGALSRCRPCMCRYRTKTRWKWTKWFTAPVKKDSQVWGLEYK